MISQEQTDKLTRLFGLEWVDYIEEIEMDDAEEALENYWKYKDLRESDYGVAISLMDSLAEGLDVTLQAAKKWDEHVSNLQEHGGV
jgi:hypothetical protein